MSETTILRKPASMVGVMKYMGYENPAQFRKDWSEMTDTDKDQLKQGIGDETLTYVLTPQQMAMHGLV